MIPGESIRATQDKNNRPGPDAAELYKTPVKDKLRRKLSPYVSFEERDTDLFHMCRVSVVNELELVTWSLRWRGASTPSMRPSESLRESSGARRGPNRRPRLTKTSRVDGVKTARDAVVVIMRESTRLTSVTRRIGIFYNDDTQWHARGVPRLRE